MQAKTPATPQVQSTGSKTLFVGNLSFSIEKEDVYVTLYSHEYLGFFSGMIFKLNNLIFSGRISLKMPVKLLMSVSPQMLMGGSRALAMLSLLLQKQHRRYASLLALSWFPQAANTNLL